MSENSYIYNKIFNIIAYNITYYSINKYINIIYNDKNIK